MKFPVQPFLESNVDFFLLLLELIMLCDYITRGYGDHPPLTIVVPRGSRRPKEGVTHGERGR